MPQMISLRTFRLATVHGHVLRFTAKEPLEVPESFVSDAMKAGCALVDPEDQPFIDDLTRSKVEFPVDVRKSIIFLAVKSVAESGNVKLFDAGGFPKKDVIEKKLGHTVANDELRDIYQQYMGIKQNGGEYPLHESAPNILKVIEAETNKELQELAVEFGVDPEKSKGLSVKDLRRLLLHKFSGTHVGT